MLLHASPGSLSGLRVITSRGGLASMITKSYSFLGTSVIRDPVQQNTTFIGLWIIDPGNFSPISWYTQSYPLQVFCPRRWCSLSLKMHLMPFSTNSTMALLLTSSWLLWPPYRWISSAAGEKMVESFVIMFMIIRSLRTQVFFLIWTNCSAYYHYPSPPQKYWPWLLDQQHNV